MVVGCKKVMMSPLRDTRMVPVLEPGGGHSYKENEMAKHHTIKIDTLGRQNEIQFKAALITIVDTLKHRPGETVVLEIDEVDSALKVQIGHGPWSPPIFGVIESE